MHSEFFFALLFWSSIGILAYTFLGYPLLVYFLVRLFPKNIQTLPPPEFSPALNEKAREDKNLPTVTVVLAAHNEEQRISPRLQNLLSSVYPQNKLDIVIVSDGSTDKTVERIRELNNVRVQSIVQQQRSGKAQCLNVGVAAAKGEIIVFCDVRQRFDPSAIARLAVHFANPQIGAVSGALEIESSASAIGGGVDAYWRLEKFLRFAESQFDSSIGCTGAIYAIRRSIFKDIPPDTLLDDVVIPMQIALQNNRVIFEPAAIAYDPQTLEPGREKIRKQRTLAGNYQMFFRYPGWLLPWRNRLWWQLLSHKYLRLAAPFFMLLLFFSHACLRELPFYNLLFAAQCAFYVLAMLGAAFSSTRLALFSIPAGFVFLNLMSLSGLRHYLCGSYRQGSWPTARS